MFIQHPDGYFVIAGVMVPGEVFRRMEPSYRLPEGFSGRIYEPGVRHVLTTGSRQDPQGRDWPEGDRYIAQARRYTREAQRRRRAVNAPRMRRKVERNARQQQSRLRRRIGGGGG